MSPAVTAVIAATVVAAGFVQGTTGIGFALIVAPVLGFLAPELVPVCLLVLMIPLNVYVAWRERAALDRRGATWITLGRFVGTFGGLWLLTLLSSSHLNILIGAATVLAVIATLVAPAFRPGRPAYVTAGLVTGVTETATGIGGPPLALVYQHEAAPVLRSTIAFCFLVGELISLLLLALAGQTGLAQFAAAAALMPALALGAIASRWVHHRLGGRLLRAFVLAFAMIAGAVLLFRH